jgi:putative ABC transport system permease protein
MFVYQLKSAFVSLKRYPVLSGLIVLAIALGLAATVSILTLVARLGDDPVPGKSQYLHAIRLDGWDTDGYNTKLEPPDQVTYKDAMALWERAPAKMQAPMYKLSLAVTPTRADIAPTIEQGRTTSRHFFEMFDYEFIEGGSWSEADDRQGTQVTVLSEKFKTSIFGDASALGQNLEMGGQQYRVIGVLKDRQRLIRAHDVTNGPLLKPEKLFIPFRTAIRLEIFSQGDNNCWDRNAPGFSGRLQSNCIWLQYWAYLPDASARAEYQRFIDGYADEQRKLGLFPRTTRNNHVLPIIEHLKMEKVVSDDLRLAVLVGLGLLLVALTNATCMLLAKFLRGSREAAVHRALGASKRMIFRQHLLEAAIIASFSAVLATVLTWLVLFSLRRFDSYLAEVAQIDVRMMVILIGLSFIGTALAAALPAWRVSRLPPAASLRSN